ncbi:hypothetical protein ACP4OV_026165 [Aristida adscensionis]
MNTVPLHPSAGGRVVLVDPVGWLMPPRLMLVPRGAPLPRGVREVTPVLAVAASGPRGRLARGDRAVAAAAGGGGGGLRVASWAAPPAPLAGGFVEAAYTASPGGTSSFVGLGVAAAPATHSRPRSVRAAASAGAGLGGAPGTAVSVGTVVTAGLGATGTTAGMHAASVATRRGRLAVVAGASATPGGGDGNGDGDDVPSDREGVVSSFRMAMEVYRISQRPAALLGGRKDLLDAAHDTAELSNLLIESLLANKTVKAPVFEDLVRIGETFINIQLQTRETYLKADAVFAGIQGLKLIGNLFFEGDDLPDYAALQVPHSSMDMDKESYFLEAVSIFVMWYTALALRARHKYGFRPDAK